MSETTINDDLLKRGEQFEESLIQFKYKLEEKFDSLPQASENLTFLQNTVAEYARDTFKEVGEPLVNIDALFNEVYQGVIWGPHDHGKTVFFAWDSENDIIAETEHSSGVGTITWHKDNLIKGIIGAFSVNQGAII